MPESGIISANSAGIKFQLFLLPLKNEDRLF